MTTIFKKFIFFALTFLFFTSAANAQYYSAERNMSLGFTFSPTASWLSYSDSDTYKPSSKVGYLYGLIADLGFARNYFFSTGFQINTQYGGAFGSGSNTDGLVDKTYRLQYAEVPLTIKLKTNENRTGRFYGQFGFTAGVKVSGKERVNTQSNYTPIDGEDLFRLGLQMGLGAEWNLTRSLSAVAGLSYNNGFTRTMKDGAPKLSYVALNIGLLF
ncbi:porin family protein [Sphingobacterium sp. LRF_L2]|uniref:porin family protein n=1 Tax=Sphingobacterium sp. LRF_L2 TaxID=3369421 RepID=UPI003F621958